MALTREQARAREHHELRRYLQDFIESPGLVVEALILWEELQHASVDNILWAALRHQAGDPGTLRAKIEVRAARNGLDTARDEIIQRLVEGWQPVHQVSKTKGFVWERLGGCLAKDRYEPMPRSHIAILYPQCVAGVCDTCRGIDGPGD